MRVLPVSFMHLIALHVSHRHARGSLLHVAQAFSLSSHSGIGGGFSCQKLTTETGTITTCRSAVSTSTDSTAASTTAGKGISANSRQNITGSEKTNDIVIVKRNRQSMSFRSGSPLVFSGAIESTITRTVSDESSPPSMGSLVLVSVSAKKEKGGGGGGRGKDRRRGGKKIPHQTISPLALNDASTEEAQMLKQAQGIGFGVYNPSSMYRVRILCHETCHRQIFRQVKHLIEEKGRDGEKEALSLIVKSKLRDAVKARLFLSLPSESTNTYRLVNGEGDGLSGLAVDVLGGSVAVVMSSAAWVEIHKDLIIDCLDQVLKNDHPSYKSKGLTIVWRNTPSRLRQDGYYEREDENTSTYNDHKNQEENNDNKDECVVVVKETGVLYRTFPFSNSQKTGFYCDQRNNRLDVARLCEGKRVLDLCCYNGGFALNAKIHGGAQSCLGVDSSFTAIDAANANAKLNNLDDSSVTFIRDDIAQYMKQANSEHGEFDVIILDPPKLAPSASGLERASRKYHALNRDAMKLISKTEGGLLLTCTCSGAMTQKDGGNFFLQTVKNAALAAGRQVTLLQKSGAAPCHTQCPASYPAGNYLTAALFYVGPEA